MIRFFTRPLARFFRREDGNATIEFAFYFSTLFILLSAGVEVAYVNMRHAMLERAVDLSVRDIRLATGHIPDYATVRDDICEAASVVSQCERNVRLEMIQVDPRDFDTFQDDVDCINAREEPRPVRQFQNGQENELMLIRACLKYKPVFPTTGIASKLDIDAHGYAKIIVSSAFVQEPR